jgi:hypothetical protein
MNYSKILRLILLTIYFSFHYIEYDSTSRTQGVGFEPCNYIRGFILLKYTKRLNEIFGLC